ncbi:MAG TPA: radical SAM protein, partial [Kofleriaceae bacterium]|nr:radical SAM protein [Kofleriaceae bacterium]
RLCFTGHYAAMNHELLAPLGHILAGEYEAELVALAEGRAPARTTIGKLDFPRPARAHLPPLDHYARLDMGDGQERLVGYTEATRGCLDRCRHCPLPAVYGGRFFVVPRDVVLADVAAQVDAGAQHITFGDPDFLNGPGHARALLRELHARWPALSFDITAQISHLLAHRDLVAELPGLGCAFVVSAVESLSDRVLAMLHKRHRRTDVVAALELAAAAGLALRPTLVPFTPWTEMADLTELVDFIDDHALVDHLDPIQLTVRLLVPPGSLLLGDADAPRWFGPLDAVALTHSWRAADPRLDVLQQALSARMAAAAESEEAPRDTYVALRALIDDAAGRRRAPPALPPRRRVPRLTEPWFC